MSLRIGFLSGVRHAGPYARILAADERVHLVGVAEQPDVPEWIRAYTAAMAVDAGLPLHDDLDALLDPDVVDAVVVCSEPTRHAALALRALEAGLHVIVDKPVATTPADADALARAARRSTGTLGIVNRRASPAVTRLRRWVDAGHVGLPLHVDVEWFAAGAHFATSVERPELVVDPALSGGGELLNFLLYPVDHVRFLTGLEVEDVYCEASTLFSSVHAEHGVEDCAVVSLRLERGVTATVTLGRVPAAPGLGPVNCSIRLLGSHGNATADDDHPQVRRYTTDGGVEALPVGGPSSEAILRLFWSDVVDRLCSGRAPSYGIADARASLAVTEAAVISARTGRCVAPTATAPTGTKNEDRP